MKDLHEIASDRMKLQSLFRDISVYGLARLCNKAVALVGMVFLARYLPVADFGIVDYLNVSLTFLTLFIVFGQESAVARYFVEAVSIEDKKQIVSQSFAFQLTLVALAVSVLWAFADRITGLLLPTEKDSRLIHLVLLQVPFFVCISFSQNLLRWTLRRGYFCFLSVGSTVTSVLCLLFAFSICPGSISLVLMIDLATRIFFGLCGLWFVREWLVIPGTINRLRILVPYGIPFGVISISEALLPFIERYTAQSSNEKDLGLLAAGAKFASLVALPVAAFQTSWGPFSLSTFKEPGADRVFQRVLWTKCLILCCLVLFLTAIAEPAIVLVLADQYQGAGVFVFALSFGIALQSMSTIICSGIHFAMRPFQLFWGYGTFVTVGLVCIPSFLKLFGIVGIAWGGLVACLGKLVVEAICSHHIHQIDFRLRRPLLMGVFTLIVGLMHQLLYKRCQIFHVGIIPFLGLLILVSYGFIQLLHTRRAYSSVREKEADQGGAIHLLRT
jgi:O-antigen/teichoic acid export membrane protein